jgi:A/G-specific adenine glycosylase
MTRGECIQSFVRKIWEWYGRNKRDLPWRDLAIKDDTERAYRVLVSEVMLQQTQVARVIGVYKKFLEKFPTLEDLAVAPNRDVLMAWRGMGYNSRALWLRDCARVIVMRSENVSNSIFPFEMDELMVLPGIGHYTAAAIRNFAFYLPTPCIETNIRKVLHTRFVGPRNPDGTWKKGDRYLLELAEEVLHVALAQPTTNSLTPNTSDWHHALMDYGALALPKVRSTKKQKRKEPGRAVGSVYVPNRIFRGKIVEELRDAKDGLTQDQIGKRVCIDWNPIDHRGWLNAVLGTLESDTLIEKKQQKYVLCG